MTVCPKISRDLERSCETDEDPPRARVETGDVQWNAVVRSER